MAAVEKIEAPIAETSLIRTAVGVSLPLIRGTGQVFRFFFTRAIEVLKGIFHFFSQRIGTIWQLLWNSSRPE